MHKKGSLLVEALIAILIVSMAIGIGLLSSYNLLRKASENRIILNMSEILLNECEQVLSLNQSQIYYGTKTISYGGENYTVTITREVKSLSSKFKFYRFNGTSYTEVSKPTPLVINNVVFVRVRVTDSKGRYVETKVVPQQW